MPQHPFNEERPDHLPIAAGVWDIAPQYSSGNNAMAAALYRAIKQLETEVVALRGG
jgi:hypothetical protein